MTIKRLQCESSLWLPGIEPLVQGRRGRGQSGLTQDRGRDCIQGEALTAAEGEERQYWEGRDG